MRRKSEKVTNLQGRKLSHDFSFQNCNNKKQEIAIILMFHKNSVKCCKHFTRTTTV